MPFVPTINTVEVEVRWTLDNQKCENTFAVDMTEAVTTANMIELSDIVQTWISAHYRSWVPSTVTFTELVLTDISVEAGEQRSVSLAVAGTADGASLPNEASFCVSLRTGFSGRSRRGRWYTPPPTVADRSGINNVTTGYRDTAVGALQALIDAIQAGGFFMCVVSRVLNGVPRAGGFITRYNTAIAVDTVIDSQRRRKPGNGS